MKGAYASRLSLRNEYVVNITVTERAANRRSQYQRIDWIRAGPMTDGRTINIVMWIREMISAASNTVMFTDQAAYEPSRRYISNDTKATQPSKTFHRVPEIIKKRFLSEGKNAQMPDWRAVRGVERHKEAKR